MRTDRSSDFTIGDSNQYVGKPNRRCPHCKKSIPYDGNKLFCPNCKKRYTRYTITNSKGVSRGLN